LLMARGRL